MIEELQSLMNKYFGFKLVVDGKLGENTNNAIEKTKVILQQINVNNTQLLTKLKYYDSNYKKIKSYFDLLMNDIFHFSNEYGYDWLMLMAQFALEVDYGEGIILDTYNLGNIKAKDDEEFVISTTHEYIKGEKIKIDDKFRKYENYQDFLIEYHCLIKNKSRYIKAYMNRKNPLMFYRGLVEGEYATDMEYEEKMANIYNIIYTFYEGFIK